MKFLFFTVILALSAFESSQSAQAQTFTGSDRVLIDKAFVDGCIIGPIPDTQP